MEGADFDVFVFLGYAAGDVELARLGVEVERRDADGEGGVDAGAGGGAGAGFGGDAADGGGAEEVEGGDEVVGVPLGRLVVVLKGLGRCRRGVGEGGCGEDEKGEGGNTISSGSSGRRTTVPEPSRSMFCLMSRILLVLLCCVQRDGFCLEKRGVVGGVGLCAVSLRSLSLVVVGGGVKYGREAG